MEMTEMKHLKLFLVAAVVLFGVGCKTSQENAHAAICEVFSDFEYAGSVQQFTQVGTITPEHHSPLPARFEPGAKYVFFHHVPLRNSEMETVTIPIRLRSHGFDFMPITTSDLIYPDAGGPLFTLDFQGRCSGTITNVVHRRIVQDPSLRNVWALEAYILEVKAKC
jgi:hypothetical protein